jgi:hypothetical protein
MRPSDLYFAGVNAVAESAAVAAFLAAHVWPYHTTTHLDLATAATLKLGPPSETRAFWIEQGTSASGWYACSTWTTWRTAACNSICASRSQVAAAVSAGRPSLG